MTEQMTGDKGPAGTERPAGTEPRTAGPSGPTPRDLAARSPHQPTARTAADQPRPAEAPLPAGQAVPGPAVPAQAAPGPAAPGGGPAPRGAGLPRPGRPPPGSPRAGGPAGREGHHPGKAPGHRS